ncbi:MAG: TolC family protein [Polyangiaceae bacterium]|nr:TolC family protein [Polyangiaceae bacterium]MCW5792008.1 TolC family protein [Polyangiaceae bacterium]
MSWRKVIVTNQMALAGVVLLVATALAPPVRAQTPGAAPPSASSDAKPRSSAPSGTLSETPETAGASTAQLISLRRALALAASRSPRLATARSEVPVAQAELTSAEARPNPTLSYSGAFHVTGNDPVDGTQHQLFVEQPLWTSGQVKGRRAAAIAGVAAARAEVLMTEHELMSEVRRAFVELLAAQARAEVLRKARGELASAARVVAGRARAGELRQYDVARTEVEVSLMETELDHAEAERADAAVRLAVLLGAPALDLRVEGSLSPLRLDVAALATKRSAASHPRVLAARERERAASSGVRAADASARIVPSVGAGALVSTHGYGAAALVSVSTPLPLFDTAEGPRRRARAEHQRELLARREAELSTQGEIHRAAKLLEGRRAALARFDRSVSAKLPELRRMAEASYLGGQTSIGELLDALSATRELALARIEHRLRVKLAEVELLAAVGRVREYL